MRSEATQKEQNINRDTLAHPPPTEYTLTFILPHCNFTDLHYIATDFHQCQWEKTHTQGEKKPFFDGSWIS